MSDAQLRQIFARRFKLATGVGGGIPLGMGLGSQLRVLRALMAAGNAADASATGVVALGFGDAMPLALLRALGLGGPLGGAEFNAFEGHQGAQSAARRMLALATPGVASTDDDDPVLPLRLHWGLDILDVQTLQELVPPTVGGPPLLAYSFDDSIPLPARRWWYALLERDERVRAVCTAWHASLPLATLLPSFRLARKMRVRLEGGRCSRTMLVLQRRVGF